MIGGRRLTQRSEDEGGDANNLLEVMKFRFKYTTVDPKDTFDRGVLASYGPQDFTGVRIERAPTARLLREACVRTTST